MKIVFDARVLTHKTYTGVENYTEKILEKLKEIIGIVLVKPFRKNRYLAHLWNHFVLPFKKGDILFCPANIAPIYVPKSKKLILTVHDVAFKTYPQSFSSFFRFYYNFIIPINIKRADKIITVSNYSKKEIEKYFPFAKDKIEVVCLGVDKQFKHLNIEKKSQILYVGSINERKNFKGVIKAFESLKAKNYQLLVVGNFFDNFQLDEATKQLINKAKESENIRFLSNVTNNELVKLYNESKLFVFPSFYEGFGFPVLEAIACGTPVITSNVSSLPEVGGDAVLYCNPNDIDDIAKKMEMVLKDEALQQKMIEKGLQRAKLFTWEKAAKEHIKVFEEVRQN